MSPILFIGIGGFLGSVSRYLVTGWVHDLLGNPSFPYGTLAVNVLGCLVIGSVAGLIDARDLFNQETRAFVVTGFLGGFTTYSAFGLQTTTLLRDGAIPAAMANVGLQIILGVGAAFLGYLMFQRA